MHQDLAVELRAQLDQGAHERDGALAHSQVIARDREAFGFDQEPMQSGDGNAGVSRSASDRRALVGAETIRRLSKRERRDLESIVAKLGR